jgi:CRP-like cAMP-binding protein
MNSFDGTRNRLLALTSAADQDRLAPAMETIDFEGRQILETPGEIIGHAYFVESGLVSVVGTAPPNHRIEIGIVGYEGMSGLGIVLGDDRSPNQTIVQPAGSATRISAQSLREAMSASQTLTNILLR